MANLGFGKVSRKKRDERKSTHKKRLSYFISQWHAVTTVQDA